jgi:hypothetical protein
MQVCGGCSPGRQRPWDMGGFAVWNGPSRGQRERRRRQHNIAVLHSSDQSYAAVLKWQSFTTSGPSARLPREATPISCPSPSTPSRTGLRSQIMENAPSRSRETPREKIRGALLRSILILSFTAFPMAPCGLRSQQMFKPDCPILPEPCGLLKIRKQGLPRRRDERDHRQIAIARSVCTKRKCCASPSVPGE